MDRNMNVMKRIAFAAGDINRKSLIEWSYYNQDILKSHELIATGITADILEGTIGVTVHRLPDGTTVANQQLLSMIAEQQIDILLFFWEPSRSLQSNNDIHTLYDLALANNIIIASNLATADFVLSSVLMDKTHAVPLTGNLANDGTVIARPGKYAARQPVLKLNYIN